ncbi:pentapeptide repeat-containing protein [Paludibaculum fermentans]|uniref:pentapeptide repeat-containing protein n=1 Tax=Paludibaculum fermentans TaxID=1473598 RepID=UPI003EC0965C
MWALTVATLGDGGVQLTAMSDPEHVRLFTAGRDVWNDWRSANPQIAPDLCGTMLATGVTYENVNFSDVDLSNCNFSRCHIRSCDFTRAKLIWASFDGAKIVKSNFAGADLTNAECVNAYVLECDFSYSKLDRVNFTLATIHSSVLNSAEVLNANLDHCRFVQVDVEGAIFRACHVHGVSAWCLEGTPGLQQNLYINRDEQPSVTVDNLEVAQFIYLLLNNEKIRHVVETITSKVVLILGRFTPERKVVLDAIRDELRKRDYLPVLFDFEKPSNRDITETVSTLAHMARFVIADITDAKSIPQELMLIVPALPSVPVQPLLLASQQEYGMFEHFKRYPWVLEPFFYENLGGLLAMLTERVIGPAETRAREQTAS